jgi:hypothetical protein
MRNRLSTGALARRSARRPWLTIGAWLGAFVAAGFLIASLLGDRNWYLPRRLEWLPDLRVEPARGD